MQQAPRACHLCTVTYLEGHEDFVSCTAISTDSKLVASGSYDAAIKLWFQEWPTALRSWSNAHLHTAGRKAHPHAFTYGCVSNTCIWAKCHLAHNTFACAAFSIQVVGHSHAYTHTHAGFMHQGGEISHAALIQHPAYSLERIDAQENHQVCMVE